MDVTFILVRSLLNERMNKSSEMDTNESDSEKDILRSGYDLPVYGLSNGTFYYLHITALFCIFCSFSCVVITLTLALKNGKFRKFFSWSKSNRFVVYLAICDGTFNIAHSMDHLHYIITKEHVRPKELCNFYGFLLVEFISAQILMVNIVAINAFMIMVFKKQLMFGKYDWRVLTWTFGFPLVCATIAEALDQFGPTGSYCLFDGVKGGIANIVLTTTPIVTFFTLNSALYILTWRKIKLETSRLHQHMQTEDRINNKSERAAKNMSMFVVAFIIQWWPLVIMGIWTLFDANVPQALVQIATVFCNIGGCLNLCVYLIIRRRNRIEAIETTS